MPQITMRELLESGVHFGHQTKRWNPKMKPYVFGSRNGIYIIDLQKTAAQTRKAGDFIKQIVAEGKKVLFVGTKKQAKDVVEEEAKRAGMHYVTNRWLGGMLTNYPTVKVSIDRLKKIELFKLTPEWESLSKKEQGRVERDLQNLTKSLGGIQEMKKLPGAIFIVDTEKEHLAIKEAKKLGIPTIAVVDTNCSPLGIDIVIPGNDDAIRSIRLFAQFIADSCLEGTQLLQEAIINSENMEKAFTEASLEEAALLEGKKVSRFEGDIDLQGVDEADLAVEGELEPETEETQSFAEALKAHESKGE